MVILALLILILAAGTSYWLIFQQHPSTTATTTTRETSTSSTQSPIQFAFLVGPPFFHVAPAEGKNITAFVQRSTDFTGAIKVDILNPPTWVHYTPVTIQPKDTNGTFQILASKDAPKTELNLTVRASSAGVAHQFALLDMKVVSVANVTGKFGSAVVYNTTKVLSPSSLKAFESYVNGTFTFSTMTQQLRGLARGDVIIVPPKSIRAQKYGLMRTVISVTRQGGGVVVQTIQASLFDELQALNFGNTGGNAMHSAAQSHTAPAAYGPSDWYCDTCWFPLFDSEFGTGAVDIGGGDTFSATGHFAVSFAPAVHFTWSNGLDYFRIHLGVIAEEDVSLAGNEGTILNWNEPEVEGLFDDTIPIFDDIVWVSVRATMEGRASGPLNQNVNLNMHIKFGYEVGPTYDTMDTCYPNADPAEHCGYFVYSGLRTDPAQTAEHSVNSITAGTGSAARVEIGPRLEVSVNGGLGGLINAGIWGSVSVDLYQELDSLIPEQPASWWVDWGLDAYADLGVKFSVLWGVYSWEGTIKDWPLGNLLGPTLLFEGTTLPPVVKIIFPQQDQALDVSSGVVAPGFKATATSPQDGDLCNTPGTILVWTDEDGQIGTKCNLLGETFKHDGDYHIVFTATDTTGATSSSQPAHVTVKVAKPVAYIISPTTADTIYVNDPIIMEGEASLGLSDLSCDNLLFTIYSASAGPGSAQTFKTTKSYGWCEADLQHVPSAGTWVVTLTATSSNGYQATAIVQVDVKALPQNPQPLVKIDPPGRGQLTQITSTVQLQGSVYSRSGEKVDKYVWTIAVGSNAQTPIMSDDLSNQDCHAQPCQVSASFQADQYCTLNTPTDVTITLTAHQGSVSGKAKLTVTLLCQKLAAPPSFGFAWGPLGGILVDQPPRSKSSSSTRFTNLLWFKRQIP
jgi:hypothetical protein